MEKALWLCNKDNPEQISLQKAAVETKIAPSSLSAWQKGQPSQQVAHKPQQLLTSIEEKIMAAFICIWGWRGEPVNSTGLWDLAKDICGTKPGEKWVYGFLKQNPSVRFCWAKKGELKWGN